MSKEQLALKVQIANNINKNYRTNDQNNGIEELQIYLKDITTERNINSHPNILPAECEELKKDFFNYLNEKWPDYEEINNNITNDIFHEIINQNKIKQP
jgi:hypothetical protein